MIIALFIYVFYLINEKVKFAESSYNLRFKSVFVNVFLKTLKIKVL